MVIIDDNTHHRNNTHNNTHNRTRFGRDSFQEALKLGHRLALEDVDWTKFRYMVFDTPNHQGTYAERYSLLGK